MKRICYRTTYAFFTRLHLLCILRPQVSKNPLRRTLTVQEHKLIAWYRILFKGEVYDSFLVTSLLLLLLLALP